MNKKLNFKDIKEFLKRLWQGKTFRQVLINTLGGYSNIFFVAFFALIIVRLLNPAEYGVFSVLFGVAFVLANILDLGVSASVYSNIPNIYENKFKLRRFVKVHFLYQTIASSFLLVLFFFFFEFLDQRFFKTGVSKLEVLLLCFSVLLFVWQNFLVNMLLAAKKILFVNLIVFLGNIVKMVLLFTMIFLKKVSLLNLIFILGIIGPLFVIFLALLNKKQAFVYSLKEKVDFKEIDFSYVFGFFLATQLFSLATRMDLFMVSYYLDKATVGFYGLSQKVSLTVLASVTSVTQVLSPQFSKVKTRSEFRRMVKKAFFFLMLPLVAYLAVFLVPEFVYTLAFTEKYRPAVPIIKFMALAYLFIPILNVPYLSLLYVFKKSKYLLLNNFFYLLVVTVGCYFLIPRFGVWGALASLAAANILAFLTLSVFALKEAKSLKK